MSVLNYKEVEDQGGLQLGECVARRATHEGAAYWNLWFVVARTDNNEPMLSRVPFVADGPQTGPESPWQLTRCPRSVAGVAVDRDQHRSADIVSGHRAARGVARDPADRQRAGASTVGLTDKCGLPVHDASNVHIPDGHCQRRPAHVGSCDRYAHSAAQADGVCFYCRAALGTPHVETGGKRCPEDCQHGHPMPEVCDQTLGVYCTDCDLRLGVCWIGRALLRVVVESSGGVRQESAGDGRSAEGLARYDPVRAEPRIRVWPLRRTADRSIEVHGDVNGRLDQCVSTELFR